MKYNKLVIMSKTNVVLPTVFKKLFGYGIQKKYMTFIIDIANMPKIKLYDLSFITTLTYTFPIIH